MSDNIDDYLDPVYTERQYAEVVQEAKIAKRALRRLNEAIKNTGNFEFLSNLKDEYWLDVAIQELGIEADPIENSFSCPDCGIGITVTKELEPMYEAGCVYCVECGDERLGIEADK